MDCEKINYLDRICGGGDDDYSGWDYAIALPRFSCADGAAFKSLV